MKIVEETSSRLIMEDNNLFMKLWCIMMPVFSAIALVLILSDYNPKLQPAIIICCIFIVIGLFGVFFMQKTLTYHLDKVKDKISIYYPVRFATQHSIETFSISEIKHLAKKIALGFKDGSDENARSISYWASGFDFVLKSGKKIHCGIYSSNHDEIIEIIGHITGFTNIPVIEIRDNEEEEQGILPG